MRGKDGKDLEVGLDVLVGPPKPSDMHQHEFQGTIVELYPDRDELCVSDQDGECFDVDADNVEAA